MLTARADEVSEKGKMSVGHFNKNYKLSDKALGQNEKIRKYCLGGFTTNLERGVGSDVLSSSSQKEQVWCFWRLLS